jgi:DNA replication and repair protein RecF
LLNTLTIENLRNISQTNVQPSTNINLFLGVNGSGKSSILEAIYLLALGRSFRTNTLKSAIKFDNEFFRVLARTSNDLPVGVQYDSGKGMQIRLNSMPLKRLSELATQLPLQYISANCHQFFEQGPRFRRQQLDWAVFHVEHEFNYVWNSYKKIIRQRNHSLKTKQAINEITIWDKQLISFASQIDIFRQQLLDKLLPIFSQIFSIICPSFVGATYTLKYKKGWNKAESLADVLSANLIRDRQLGYTRNGVHAADWSIKINDINPPDILSRGQQKLFFIAICMAQSILVTQHTQQKSILLVDDLSSELDESHQRNVLAEIQKLPVQSFITSTNETLSDLASEQLKVFHVKQGFCEAQ